MYIDHLITIKENRKKIDTFEHVDNLPDPELGELNGKVHVGDNGNLGLADAVSRTVSEKLRWLLLGLKFMQTEDSE